MTRGAAMRRVTPKALETRETEAQFQAKVVELAQRCGWLTYHTKISVMSAQGYPDLTLAHPPTGRVIHAELKSIRGKVRPEQRTWLWALSKCPSVEVALWRPTDWPSIEAALIHGERLASLDVSDLT